MPRFRQLTGWLAAAIIAVAGCRAPATLPVATTPPPLPPPNPPASPTELLPVPPNSLEPDLKSLPNVDPFAVPPKSDSAFRGLTKEQCRQLAAARTVLTPPNPDEAGIAEELRLHALDAERNRSAADALDQFFRLADLEARAELLRTALPQMAELRDVVKNARETGVRIPTEPAEVDRQRAAVLASLNQADLGIALLNIDLKRRVGVAGPNVERLWPVGPFPMNDHPVNVEAAAQLALERRGDLRLLRAVYWRLTPENVNAVREQLREQIMGNLPDPLAGFPHLQRLAKRRQPKLPIPSLEAETRAELILARQQWFDLIAARERQVADEVRAAGAMLTAGAKQVALARWQVESLTAKVEEAKSRGPLVELPAKLELLRARAELVAAVYGWHQTRVKWLAAQGTLADGR